MMIDLRKVNQLLWTVVGVVVLGFVITLFVLLFKLTSFGRPTGPPRIAVAPESGQVEEEGPREAVVLCLPTVVRGTETRLIGVAVVDTSVPSSERVMGSGSSYERRFSARCRLGETRDSFFGHVQNVILLPADGGDQRLLFPGRILLQRFEAPGEKCEEEPESLAGCDRLYWEVREADTNGDGAIDSDDALVPYVSALDGGDLRRMTPEGTHLVAVGRDPRFGFFLQVQSDADGDGEFGPRDPVALLNFDPTSDAGPRPAVSEAAAVAAEALLGDAAAVAAP